VKYWITDAEKKVMDNFLSKSEKLFIMYLGPRERALSFRRRKLNEDNRKWAWIIVGNTRFRAWVDNKTMKAYKADGYDKTWMEWRNFKFERWCRPMDL